MTTQTTNFLGIPVAGTITGADKAVPQRPLEEFAPIMQAVLDDPFVVEFGWDQYTPYFNDGDPCEFTIHDIWVRTTADDADRYDRWDLDMGSSHPTLNTRRWDRETCKIVPVELPADAQATAERCEALNAAVAGGAFYDVLREAFGDHAQITVKRDGITVDFYSHD